MAEVDVSGQVLRLIEKPSNMNNNLAVVGCYYFPDGSHLVKAIEEQVRKNISLKGEYFLVDAINLMLEKHIPMRIEQVKTWLDAGTSEALLDTNRHLLEHGCDCVPALGQLEDTVIIPPVFIHPDARVSTSIIGPFVSVGQAALCRTAPSATLFSAQERTSPTLTLTARCLAMMW